MRIEDYIEKESKNGSSRCEAKEQIIGGLDEFSSLEWNWDEDSSCMRAVGVRLGICRNDEYSIHPGWWKYHTYIGLRVHVYANIADEIINSARLNVGLLIVT